MVSVATRKKHELYPWTVNPDLRNLKVWMEKTWAS